MNCFSHPFLNKLTKYSQDLGFDKIGFSDVNLTNAESGLMAWLEAGCHGEMNYMSKYGLMRARPSELCPGTVSVISVRLPYLPESLFKNDWKLNEWGQLKNLLIGNISLYARGSDYHKLFRHRLQKLADFISLLIGPCHYRVFVDSAPVMEVELAKKAKLGWRGKHTLLVDRDAGSFFFLGEIFTDAPLSLFFEGDVSGQKSIILKSSFDEQAKLPAKQNQASPSLILKSYHDQIPRVVKSHLSDSFSRKKISHCGSCQRCIEICPTNAIYSPYRLDARRCIAYLTIEFKGIIPIEFRHKIGNRIYGCDDCQLICPWNKFAKQSKLIDFEVRSHLAGKKALELFSWTEQDFLIKMRGSAIKRIGYQQWLRNLAVVLGNALASRQLASDDRMSILAILRERLFNVSDLVEEHIRWAIEQDSVKFCSFDG